MNRTKPAKKVTGTVTVTAGRPYALTIKNDVGGTAGLPPGVYRVEIERAFHDRETGRIAHGRLTDPAAVKVAREAGTTGYKPEDYAEYGDNGKVGDYDHVAEVTKARAAFDPAKVYLAMMDFTPDAK